MIKKCSVEIYPRVGGHREGLYDINRITIVTLWRSIRDEWSATVRFVSEDQKLAVTISSGRAALLLIVGEDQFYDFIGDPSATGWTEVVHGGQPAEHLARHVASVEDAQLVALEFLERGSLLLDSQKWERQKEFQIE